MADVETPTGQTPRLKTVTPAGATRPASPGPKRRPDARPTRVILGLAAIAAMTVVTAGLVDLPATSADATAIDPGPVPAAREEVVRCVRYVQLRPGETPPAGATVVDGTDRTGRLVDGATSIRPRPTPAPRRRSVARSRQSG